MASAVKPIIKDADFIYLRKPSAINMGFIDFLKRVRKLNPKMKILLEIPTYPYDNEIKGMASQSVSMTVNVVSDEPKLHKVLKR